MDFIQDLIAPPPSHGRYFRLWILSVQALSHLPPSTSPKSEPRISGSEEEGTFIVLTCKTKEGATVTVIVTDWLPWFRVISSVGDEYEVLKSVATKGAIQKIKKEDVQYSKACGWEPTSKTSMKTKTFSCSRVNVRGLFCIAPVLCSLSYILGD